MGTWRTIRFSLVLLTISGLAMGLSGCGGGGSSGMQEPAKVEPVKNAKGEVIYSVDEEAKSAPGAK